MKHYRHAMFVFFALLLAACSEQASDEHVLKEKTDTMKKAEAAAEQLEKATVNQMKKLEGGEE